jgi:hypothetical protein
MLKEGMYLERPVRFPTFLNFGYSPYLCWRQQRQTTRADLLAISWGPNGHTPAAANEPPAGLTISLEGKAPQWASAEANRSRSKIGEKSVIAARSRQAARSLRRHLQYDTKLAAAF